MGLVSLGGRPRWLPPLVMVFLVLGVAASAFADRRISFSSGRDATVRMTDGSLVRCKLKSIGDGDVLVELRDRSPKTYEFDDVRSISTQDKSLSYVPGQESFDALLRRAGRISGAIVEGVHTENSSASGSAEDDDLLTPRLPPLHAPDLYAQGTNPDVDGLVSGLSSPSGFAGPSGLRRPGFGPDRRVLASLSPMSPPRSDSAEPGAASSAGPRRSGPFSVSRPGEKILCECGAELVNPQYGDVCPKCKRVFAAASTSEVVQQTSPAGGAAGGPFSGVSQGPVGGGAAPGQSAVVTSSGFSFNEMPWYLKVGCFGGLAAVLWVVAQRRG